MDFERHVSLTLSISRGILFPILDFILPLLGLPLLGEPAAVLGLAFDDSRTGFSRRRLRRRSRRFLFCL